MASTLLCIFLLLFVRCDFSNALAIQQRRWCQLKDIFILFRRFVPLSLWYRLQFVIYSSLQTCISIVWWLVMINCLSIFHQPQFLRCILSWVSIWHVCVWFEFFMTIDNEAQRFYNSKHPTEMIYAMITMNEHFSIINDDKYLNFLSRTERKTSSLFLRACEKRYRQRKYDESLSGIMNQHIHIRSWQSISTYDLSI